LASWISSPQGQRTFIARSASFGSTFTRRLHFGHFTSNGSLLSGAMAEAYASRRRQAVATIRGSLLFHPSLARCAQQSRRFAIDTNASPLRHRPPRRPPTSPAPRRKRRDATARGGCAALLQFDESNVNDSIVSCTSPVRTMRTRSGAKGINGRRRWPISPEKKRQMVEYRWISCGGNLWIK